MSHPYRDLPAKHFWGKAVANRHVGDLKDLFQPKYPLEANSKIAVAGSCFAQYLKQFLEGRGVELMDAEPPPIGLRDSKFNARDFGYGVYSGRYGNIYTAKQLLQLAQEALSGESRSADDIAWKAPDGRYVDALRPGVEPNGFATIDELMLSRADHIRNVRKLLRQSNVFIFTLGLTEAWRSIRTGLVYPLAPGVVASKFDPNEFEFVNFDYEEIKSDLLKFARLYRRSGNNKKILLTVSPVPLAATYEDQNVLLSTIYSKSVLRAVSGSLRAGDPLIDYFPSYEVVIGPNARYSFFETDARTVHGSGVNIVMDYFAQSYPELFVRRRRLARAQAPEDVHCEEILLAKVN